MGFMNPSGNNPYDPAVRTMATDQAIAHAKAALDRAAVRWCAVLGRR